MSGRALVIAKGCSMDDAIKMLAHGVDLDTVKPGGITGWTVKELMTGKPTHTVTAYGKKSQVTVYVSKTRCT